MLRNVLIVDDDREMVLNLQEGLSRRDATLAVLMAGNGVEALECLRSHDVSLVVTDLKMPLMDGRGLLSAIMQNYADIPVIAMTGFSTPEREHQLRRDGAADYISKPFSVEKLAHQMGVLLNQQSEGGILHHLSPAMFLQMIEMDQKTCTVRIEHTHTRRRGILSFVRGELFDARIGDVLGFNAAVQILAWDPVSLAIQNSCTIRKNRIRKNLYPLILEAARRQDENTQMPLADNPPLEGVPETAGCNESLESIRRRIQKALGDGGGVESVLEDPSWSERVKRISRYGEQLNLGRLTLAWVNRGQPRDYIVRPVEPPVVVAVNPKCPREKIMQILGG
jgi:CheY-like chemotaxis protein